MSEIRDGQPSVFEPMIQAGSRSRVPANDGYSPAPRGMAFKKLSPRLRTILLAELVARLEAMAWPRTDLTRLGIPHGTVLDGEGQWRTYLGSISDDPGQVRALTTLAVNSPGLFTAGAEEEAHVGRPRRR